MSRRKQAKPQHLKSDDKELETDVAAQHALLEEVDEEESCSESDETYMCEKCCVEFFAWADLYEHQSSCNEDQPQVVIMKGDERMGGSKGSQARSSPAPSLTPSLAPSDSADFKSADGDLEQLEPVKYIDNDSIDMLEQMDIVDRMDESLGVKEQHHIKHRSPCSQNHRESTEAFATPQSSALTSYSMPSTNVTLEILHSTRVAVAQFSQSLHSSGSGGKAATAAIPVILEHLLALQQQQVHQLQLIEHIRSQVAIMNRQPTQTALNPVSRALSCLPTNPFPSKCLSAPPTLPLSGTIPSAINRQASVSLASVLHRSHTLSSQAAYRQAHTRDVRCTSEFSDNSAPSPNSCTNISSLLPPYTGSHLHTSGSCTQTLKASGPLCMQGVSNRLLSSPSNLPFLPQSSPRSVIFPNPLASITATTNPIDPLSALIKHQQNGKLPNVSMFNTKPSPEEPFFKHKCRFCAKVFGSDSALQIHLRSHTGERPFKCNICGNRFSTKGNLKVHFQRHKEKYPLVQMNPYPVPEYLDNVPTSSGIPYGMSFPPEKQGATWLDSKPGLETVPSSMGLQFPTTLTSMGGLSESLSVTPSIKSPCRPSPCSSECVSLSPNITGNELNVPTTSKSPQSNQEREAPYVLKAEEIHLPQNCMTRPRASPVTVATSTVLMTTSTPERSAPNSPDSNSSSLTHSFPLSNPFKDKFPFSGLPDCIQTSETTKLQELVENIEKKITDPNQCVLCHRVLSCQSALKMHYRIHTGERPFKCKVCGRAFTTKGNLKTHVGVHRANPPLRVQHSCPICQKKFTNAVVLQQHIRMHMGGQISNSPLADSLQDMGTDISFEDKNFDSLRRYDNDCINNNSMGEEEDDDDNEEEAENMEGILDTFKTSSPISSSPPNSYAVVSSIATLENQMKMIDSTLYQNHSLGIKKMMNGFMDSERCAAIHSTVSKGSTHNAAGIPTVSDSSSCMHVSVTSAKNNSHLSKSLSENPSGLSQEITGSVKSEQSDLPTANQVLENGVALDLRGMPPSRQCVKQERPYSILFQSRERGKIKV
ncbi:hypothetical protein UPYG_G00342280 [Umbra pygmaea]|uniref:C2H2-type domain-containing protein n=1 Tax=Umbra pygmaea TaxID=75934 RepID=A0ABD0VXG2_UMBPY